jgi:hypothetical protein
MTKMRRVKYSTNQIKVEKTRFGKVNPLNDVIHVAKIVKLRRFFPAISGRQKGILEKKCSYQKTRNKISHKPVYVENQP